MHWRDTSLIERECFNTGRESGSISDSISDSISGIESDWVVLNKGIKAYFVLLTGGFESWNVRGQHLCNKYTVGSSLYVGGKQFVPCET